MRRFLFPVLVLVVVAAGCRRPATVSRHTIAQSLRGVLVYPRSTLVDMASGDSAGQLTLASPDDPDSVAAWFRVSLALNSWILQSDARQPDGSIMIYAERQTQPLWINIQRATGAAGSSYTVTGAVVGSADSTATTAAAADSTHRSGSNMSSKRIQRR